MPNEKYTLTAEQASSRLGRFWRDPIRRRANLGGDLLFCNFDETALVEDALAGSATAAEKGASSVACKVDHYASRRTTTTVIALSSGPIRAHHPNPTVTFTSASGVAIRRKLTPLAPKGIPFLFAASGKMTEALMADFRKDVESCPPPVMRHTLLAPEGGFFVSLYDSHTAHCSFFKSAGDRLIRNKIAPSRIPGGITSLAQPCDAALNKPFKAV